MARKAKAPSDVDSGVDDEISPIPPEGAGGGATDDEDKPPPPFGTPKPAGQGDVPRVVSELVRADKGSGLVRFKIACRNYGPQKTLYILAENEDQARKHYLAVKKLDVQIARLKKNGAEPEPADLVVTALED